MSRELPYVVAARFAMLAVFGRDLPPGPDHAAVVLASLDALPSGTRATWRRLPNHIASECYNAAYAACHDIREEMFREQYMVREW